MPTVVIVEDDFLIAAAYRTMAEEVGIKVLDVCDTAAAGIAAIAAHQPTFAVLDLNLAGGADGVHVAAAVRQNEIATKIIFATGSATPDTLRRLDAVGAFNVLIKPIDPKDFIAALDSDAPSHAGSNSPPGPQDKAYIAQMARRTD
ncbi:response regulator [Acuticoccus sp. MNP-M23]|uniref:response regulator n=1 Tax=Acuticoccus sp. MNP-M23 TaxID=3072793 RepID=UPI002815B6F0|nr:response regulator [Acuticoccus sp. MNP-M23]WMS43518.1 response regulator [Acuticoccus sp. MNP-M23]